MTPWTSESGRPWEPETTATRPQSTDPDGIIGGEKTKLPVKSGVVESSQTTTTDMQKGVSSEQIEDRQTPSQRTSASAKDYTKEARGKQATDGYKERT